MELKCATEYRKSDAGGVLHGVATAPGMCAGDAPRQYPGSFVLTVPNLMISTAVVFGGPLPGLRTCSDRSRFPRYGLTHGKGYMSVTVHELLLQRFQLH